MAKNNRTVVDHLPPAVEPSGNTAAVAVAPAPHAERPVDPQAFERHKQNVIRLLDLIEAGKVKSDEADTVRDELDGTWLDLTPEQRDHVEWLAARPLKGKRESLPEGVRMVQVRIPVFTGEWSGGYLAQGAFRCDVTLRGNEADALNRVLQAQQMIIESKLAGTAGQLARSANEVSRPQVLRYIGERIAMCVGG